MVRQFVSRRADGASFPVSRVAGREPPTRSAVRRERYRFAPLPSLLALALIASCASGDEPIEPAVSSGNSALIRADFASAQASSQASLAASEGVRSGALAADTTVADATGGVAPTTTAVSASSAPGTAQDDAGAEPETQTAAVAAAGDPQAPTAAVKGTLESFAADALAAINAARAQPRACGDKAFPAVGPLRWNARAAYAAMLETEWMQSTNSFGHVWPTGERVWDRLALAGYAWSKADENIAAGFRSLDAAMKGWIDSPPHCVALMRADITEVGVSVVPGNAGNTYLSYWAMVLATPQAAASR
ncbi:MAG: CAP domain-containing protein [Lautropia sp.]